MQIPFSQLRELVNGEQRGDDGGVITGFASLRDAAEGDLSFFGNLRYLADLRATKASAVLVPRDFQEPIPGVAIFAVDNPSAAFAEVVKRFVPPQRNFEPGVHPTAVIHPTAILNPAKVSVGAHAVIEAEAEIGEGTEIGAGSHIGRGARLGQQCRLAPRVSVMHHCQLGDRVQIHAGAVIGADGFGYEMQDGKYVKIDQVGIVQIDDDVEIGANTTIDRARFGRTWIGAGTKIDNQVQIGHNVTVGRNCIIIAQAGIAGSTRVADGVIIAAQAGVAGHLEIDSGVIVSAQAGVTKSLREPGPYMGFPATPSPEMRRILVCLRRLPEFMMGAQKRREKRTPRQAAESND